jgi:hypothetical protein
VGANLLNGQHVGADRETGKNNDVLSSVSAVKCGLGYIALKSVRIDCMPVWFGSKINRMSST